jgi:hypothetical protein
MAYRLLITGKSVDGNFGYQFREKSVSSSLPRLSRLDTLGGCRWFAVEQIKVS